MNEDERRELIARQHRALYGNDAALYNPDGSAPRQSQGSRASVSGSVRGPSPLAFDPFGMQAQPGAESAVQMPVREHIQANTVPESRKSTTPPSSNLPTFGMMDSVHQSSRTSGSPPTASPPASQNTKASAIAGNVAPIGTRPVQGQAANTKRSPTPNERSASAASNPIHTDKNAGLGSWGSNSAVWGKNSLGVQASVWG